MPNGYEVAARDLRTFASTLKTEGEKYKGLLKNEASTELDFWTPVVGLFYKGQLNNARQTLLDAIKLFSETLESAGAALHNSANTYEKAEEAAKNKSKSVHP